MGDCFSYPSPHSGLVIYSGGLRWSFVSHSFLGHVVKLTPSPPFFPAYPQDSLCSPGLSQRLQPPSSPRFRGGKMSFHRLRVAGAFLSKPAKRTIPLHAAYYSPTEDVFPAPPFAGFMRRTLRRPYDKARSNLLVVTEWPFLRRGVYGGASPSSSRIVLSTPPFLCF